MENENKIREIVQQVIAENQTRGQFSPMKIPIHTHNGIDNARISEVNLIHKVTFSLPFTSVSSETFQVINVPNPTGFQFHGIAAGPSARGSISGCARFGSGFLFNQTTGTDFSTLSGNDATAMTILQSCNSVYNSGSTTRANYSSINFLYVTDGSTVFAQATVTAYDSSSITIETELESGWSIIGDLIIT